MKKLISSLMAVTLVSSIAGSVTSCSVRMSKINLAFEGTFDVSEGKSDANFIAFNGTTVTPYYNPGSKSSNEFAVTKALARDVLNLLGFNHTLVTNPRQVPQLRTTFVGQDATNQNNFTPSVDGIFYGSKFEGFTEQQFYSAFEKTNISSLAGLYSLYEYGQRTGGQGMGTAAQASYQMILNVLQTQEARDFYATFLNTSNHLYDSAWTDWRYFGTAAPTKLDSKVLSFDMQLQPPVTQEDAKVNQYYLQPTAEKPNLGTEQEYFDVNTSVRDEAEGPVGNNKRGPFDLNVFTLEDAVGPASFNLDPNFKPAKGSKEITGAETWEIRQASNANAWAITATESPLFDVETSDGVKTENKSWTNGFIKTNNSVIAKVAPLTIKLTYTSNVRDSKAQKYDITFTLDGLYAAFALFLSPATFKNNDEDSKTIGNRYAKWRFTHYQFTNSNDTWVNTKSIDQKAPNNGSFSTIAIKNLLIEKHSN